ncbi:MAG TPA: DUF5658 family protein [Syntrophales bacterium]|jgi:hypothetical protein|nr:DUF5658 family protein [Syntrophales bacterium]HOX93816.1 DUF5658 family protein [Syntrophales bacterium]HPI57743.1 DUF5658 family protein [Syntrophales bacterium]HPN25847.1 DUF5658 family protein [Syntrophales bacterium]HQM30367.1 DUF5658 family protein [Syntrophales bacterium]
MAFTFIDRRKNQDRRREPTPGLSRHTISGQRKHFRRREDRLKGVFVDRYSPRLLILLVLIVVLNIMDAIFTGIILDGGGWELNPVARAAIATYGDKFWVWKFTIVSIAVVTLCLLSKVKGVKYLVAATAGLYAGIVAYEMYMIYNYLP